MYRVMFSGKIHRATVTDSNLEYEGSITIDESLLNAANMIPYEKVQVVNINNGARFETYIIKGEANSGIICVNGAASRLVERGDRLIIIAYMPMLVEAAINFQPSIALVNDKNQLIISDAAISRKRVLSDAMS